MKQLFPREIIDNSQEANFSKHSITSQVIYSTIILFIAGLISLLPFIHVDVGIRGQGIIRPVSNTIQLSAPVSGNIQTLYVSENSFIEKGEMIATLEAPQIHEQLRFIRERQDKLNFYINDLERLQQWELSNSVSADQITTARYQRSFIKFHQQRLNHEQEVSQTKIIFDRERLLFERDVNSKAELDEARFNYQAAKNRYDLMIEQQLNEWKLDEITYQNELEELQSEFIRLQEELRLYNIESPVSGTIQNMPGIFPNSFLHVNQPLGEISPDTALIAEVYISPKDIGLLKSGMPVRLQIDAYNYNQWGVETGSVVEISTDVIMNDNQPVFKVRCNLDQTALKLSNGFQGDIKKGMTFQARFVVNRRSLFNLLYDKVDDWLNPSWGENELVQS